MVGVEVLFRMQAEDWTLGRTDAAGRIPLVTVLFDLSPGTRVAVYEAPGATGPAVFLVPPGEPYEAICAGEPNCRAVGVFAWGDDAVVDLASGDVEVVREAPRTDPVRRRPPFEPMDTRDPSALPRLRVGIGAGYGVWPNLKDACDREGDPPQSACEVADTRPHIQAILEYRARPEFGLGLEMGYTPGLQVEQTFQATSNPLAAVAHAVDLSVLTIGPYGSTGFPVGTDAQLFAAIGFLWAINQGNAATAYDQPARQVSEDRSESGGRLAARAGLDWWSPGRRWGFRFEGGGMSGASDDLDMQWLGAVKLLIGLESR